jgi:hypothetical protein
VHHKRGSPEVPGVNIGILEYLIYAAQYVHHKRGSPEEPGVNIGILEYLIYAAQYVYVHHKRGSPEVPGVNIGILEYLIYAAQYVHHKSTPGAYIAIDQNGGCYTREMAKANKHGMPTPLKYRNQEVALAHILKQGLQELPSKHQLLQCQLNTLCSVSCQDHACMFSWGARHIITNHLCHSPTTVEGLQCRPCMHTGGQALHTLPHAFTSRALYYFLSNSHQ